MLDECPTEINVNPNQQRDNEESVQVVVQPIVESTTTSAAPAPATTTAAADDEDNNNVPDDTAAEERSFSTALDCLERLMNQLTVKDAPPTNTYNSSPVTRQTRGQQNLQQQQQLQCPSSPTASAVTTPPHHESSSSVIPGRPGSIGETMSFDTDGTQSSQAISTFFQDLVLASDEIMAATPTSSTAAAAATTITTTPLTPLQQQQHQQSSHHTIAEKPWLQQQQHQGISLSEQKMGHTSLTALSRWTMEQVVQGGPKASSNSTSTSTTTPSSPKENASPSIMMLPPVKNNIATTTTTTTPATTSFANNNNNNNKLSSSSPRTFWGKVWGRTPKSKYRHHHPRPDGSFPVAEQQQQEDEEETKEEPPPAETATAFTSTTTPRFHLAASEYARYLQTQAPALYAMTPSSSMNSSSSSNRKASKPKLPKMTMMMRLPHCHHASNKPPRGPIPTIETASADVQTGALLDICVTVGDEQRPPVGYYRITQTASGLPFVLGKKKAPLYLNVKKEPIWDKAAQRPCITAFCIIYPDRQEFVPPGFCIVRHAAATPTSAAAVASSGEPANLSVAATGERVYLCFRRSREGNPLTGLLPLLPCSGESVPSGYTVVERTPRNHVAYLSAATSTSSAGSTTTGSSMALLTSAPIFLAYRQRLANLECLRPLPLVWSVHEQREQQQKLDQTPRLYSYYSTGGTVVASSVGRFHILDRSTHSLLSPSSVSNRLQLIEKSRQRAENTAGAGDESSLSEADVSQYCSATSYLRSDDASSVGGVSHVSRKTFGSILEGSHAAAAQNTPKDHVSVGSSTILLGDECRLDLSNTSSSSASLFSSLLAVREDLLSESSGMVPLLGQNDENDINNPDLLVCLQALNFIPSVQVAASCTGADAQNRLSYRSALLVPLLTACYTRHGGGALVAVEGLLTLLQETDFFVDDVQDNAVGDTTNNNNNDESSTRLTLLDLAVQTVCDVATTGAEETMFSDCVEFVGAAFRYAQGQLNTRTVGYIVRFYLFVFYFGASVPTRKASRWPKTSWRAAHATTMTTTPRINNDADVEDDEEEDDFPLLLDPREIQSGKLGYLPGGAPQAAALGLKELISLSITRLGNLTITDLSLIKALSSTDLETSILSDRTADPYGSLIDSILDSVVDCASNQVERANCTQLALHQVVRSGGSELFWYDMVNVIGQGLFGKENKLSESGKNVYVMVFAILANIVKIASGKLRSVTKTDDLLPRDIASKLLSLELLLHFLEFWSDEQEAENQVETIQSVDTVSFSMRRLVAPCLLWNTKACLQNPQVFRRVIAVISELWCSPVHRRACNLELMVLMDHFALSILGLGAELASTSSESKTVLPSTNTSLLCQQVELMREIKNWFSNEATDVIEFYLNFDTDIHTQMAGPVQLLTGTKWKIFQRLCAALSEIAEQCGETIGEQIRENQCKIQEENSIWSENENLLFCLESRMRRDSAKLLRKTSLEAISQIVKCLALSGAVSYGTDCIQEILSWDPQEVESPAAYRRAFPFHPANEVIGEQMLSSVNEVYVTEEKKIDDLAQYWNEVLDDREQVKESASDTEKTLAIAFEIAKEKNIKKAIEYLVALNALTPSPRDIANFLRIHKDQLDPTNLGNFISEGGTSAAETEYWSSVRYLFVRAISFVGMDVEQALRHFLTATGFRLPGEAQKIDRLMNTFSRCFYEDNAGDMSNCPFKSQDTIYVLAFAVLMLNTDLHKTSHISRKSQMTKTDFINNLKGVVDGTTIDAGYLATLYDSISSSPIVVDDEKDPEHASEDHDKKLQGMLNNVRSADSLLRGLAVHDFKLYTLKDFTESSSSRSDAVFDLTLGCFSKTWHHWHGVINTGMENAHLDPQGMEPSVDILQYSLAATVCLGMKTECAAFLNQLGRLRVFEERRQGKFSSGGSDFREQPWFKEIEQACFSPPEQKLTALKKIRYLVHSLQAALSVGLMNKAEMIQAVDELKNCDFLLNDPVRAFLRSGDLTKRSTRNGKSTEYRFFLFSDVLLYGSKDSFGRYRIHEELPLHLMKIIDWFPPSQRNRTKLFQVHHPRKSFQVLCPTEEGKKEWVLKIRNAIKLDIQRKVSMEAARLSFYTRVQP